MIVCSTLCLRCATTKIPSMTGNEWHIADISGLLREERYDELDERYNQALMESFTSREAKSAISSPGIKWTTLFTIWTRWLRLGRKD